MVGRLNQSSDDDIWNNCESKETKPQILKMHTIFSYESTHDKIKKIIECHIKPLTEYEADKHLWEFIMNRHCRGQLVSLHFNASIVQIVDMTCNGNSR